MTFFDAIDPRTLRALREGAVIRATYDELGARRPSGYHTITGTVTLVTEDAERGLRITLADVTRTRPSGDVTVRPGLVLDGRKIMELT